MLILVLTLSRFVSNLLYLLSYLKIIYILLDVDGASFINSNKYVKLNVGGSLHYTTMGTLTKEDNMLRAMFSGRMVVLTDSEGKQI